MQISSNYSMNGVPYENRRRQNDIPQFSTERAEQENESINPYMEDTDFNEKAFDMIGPNAPQDVKDAWMEAAKEVNANGMGIKKNGMLSHISQMMIQRPKSIEVQRACMKEREFYVAFLEKLEKLKVKI